MALCEGTAGAGLQISLKLLGNVFFGEGNVDDRIPGCEFSGVERFSGVVFGEALAEIVGRADVDFVRVILASEDVDVVHRARPPSLGVREVGGW